MAVVDCQYICILFQLYAFALLLVLIPSYDLRFRVEEVCHVCNMLRVM